MLYCGLNPATKGVCSGAPCEDFGAGQCQALTVTVLDYLFGATKFLQFVDSSAGTGFAWEGPSCAPSLPLRFPPRLPLAPSPGAGP